MFTVAVLCRCPAGSSVRRTQREELTALRDQLTREAEWKLETVDERLRAVEESGREQPHSKSTDPRPLARVQSTCMSHSASTF